MIYDAATTRKVRLLIPDRTEGAKLFTDDDIADFLDMEGGVLKLAAAQALGVIATDVAMTIKYIKTNSMEQDGTKPANVVLNRAKMLENQVKDAAENVEETADEEDAWDFG